MARGSFRVLFWLHLKFTQMSPAPYPLFTLNRDLHKQCNPLGMRPSDAAAELHLGGHF